MALTPIDIQQKTFGTALRGYDLDEVDEFLDEVVSTLRDQESALAEARQRIFVLEEEISRKGDVEGEIARVLVAAQRTADGLLDEARAEAERLLEEARLDAERMIAEAENRAETLAGERDEEAARVEADIEAFRANLAVLREAVSAIAARASGEADAIEEAIADAERRHGSLLGELLADVADPEMGSAVEAGEDEVAASWHDPAWESASADAPDGDAVEAEADAVEGDEAVGAERTPRPWEDN